MKSLRAHGWVRDVDNKDLFFSHFEKPSNDFYEFFHFVLPGYNFRPTEVQGALGLQQLKKLDGFIEARIKNARYFQEKLEEHGFDFKLQQEENQSASSWFGFGLLCSDRQSRDNLVQKLNQNSVECRPIVTGNMLRQPVFSGYARAEDFPAAERIHECGVMIGNHQFPIKEELDYFISLVREV